MGWTEKCKKEFTEKQHYTGNTITEMKRTSKNWNIQSINQSLLLNVTNAHKTTESSVRMTAQKHNKKHINTNITAVI